MIIGMMILLETIKKVNHRQMITFFFFFCETDKNTSKYYISLENHLVDSLYIRILLSEKITSMKCIKIDKVVVILRKTK